MRFAIGLEKAVRTVASALFALVVFLSQLHLCPPRFVFADGSECLTCSSTDNIRTESSKANQTAVASKADCKACCTLAGCSHGSKGNASATNRTQYAPAVLTRPVDQTFVTDFVPRLVLIPSFESAPATGPPSLTSPRAPPQSTLGIT